MNYMGYLNTTGIDAIRFRMVDHVTDPPGDEALNSEELLRLDGAFLCYGGPREAPEVVPPPLLSRGEVTFGSFNTLDKISGPVLDAWAAVLLAVPRSRLLIKAAALADETLRAKVAAEFVSRGVDAARVQTRAKTNTTREHLELYGEVDIALDTWPYNGVTTTCEAMWMGVPVVAMRGDRHQARVSESFLIVAGLGEWIASDQADFVRIASSLAADNAALATTRATLRERVKASSLCDGAGKIRQIEAHCRAAWQRWCCERW
jgi:predicted O-linked N-acetylglucosamine transferase (SPINDLY family)